MINNKKVVVIMPAYNAEKPLEKTYNEIYKNFVDEIILVDDFSSNDTKEVAKKLNITTIVNKKLAMAGIRNVLQSSFKSQCGYCYNASPI